MSDATLQSEHLDAIYTALGHPKRRAMLTTLAFRPATVSQLAEEHEVSLPAIHKHVRMLEEAQLIQRKKVGRTNFVAINRSGLQLAKVWLAQFRADWGSDKETLENYISNFSKQ